MINKKKISFLVILLILINLKSFSEENIYIVYNVDDQIITNIDIQKESRYLIALNTQLGNLDKNEIFKISKESILREKVKQIEVLKYFDLSKENPSLNNYIKNFYLRMKLSSETEFENYLKKNDLTLTFIKQKIEIELSWNQLIYDRYKNQINIDTEKLKKKINLTSSQLNERVYLLSEIVFENSKEISFEQKVQNINESIKKIGFKNTANIYSTSDSAKFGGNIGWVEEKKLSKKILDVIKPLNINEHTLPIQIGGAFLILKKKELKVQKKIINKAEELDKRIQYESTKQLDRFSKIYYNKIKINTSINEL
jgi:peptidyl-prolyl cis-trans isomerase SurA